MTTENELIECPYCGEEFIVNEDVQKYFFNEGDSRQMCPFCGKMVSITPIVTVDYHVEKALIGEHEHEWTIDEDAPVWNKMMVCTICGERREPTKEEYEKYNIPKHKYFYDRSE